LGGRGDVMEQLAAAGHVYQAGTLSGNPLATAAGLSVLRRLRDEAVYERLEAVGRQLEEGLSPFGRVQRVGAMLTLFMSDGRPVTSLAEAQECDTDRDGALFRRLVEESVYVAPSQFEAMLVSTAHGDADVERTVSAVAGFFAWALGGDGRGGGRREAALGGGGGHSRRGGRPTRRCAAAAGRRV